MSTINYLILGLVMVFCMIVIMVSQPTIPTLAGIVIAGLTLVMVPFVIYLLRHIPKRDPKHREDDED